VNYDQLFVSFNVHGHCSFRRWIEKRVETNTMGKTVWSDKSYDTSFIIAVLCAGHALLYLLIIRYYIL